MSDAEQVARALNRQAREGLDIFDGSDKEALSHLLEDYFTSPDDDFSEVNELTDNSYY